MAKQINQKVPIAKYISLDNDLGFELPLVQNGLKIFFEKINFDISRHHINTKTIPKIVTEYHVYQSTYINDEIFINHDVSHFKGMRLLIDSLPEVYRNPGLEHNITLVIAGGKKNSQSAFLFYFPETELVERDLKFRLYNSRTTENVTFTIRVEELKGKATRLGATKHLKNHGFPDELVGQFSNYHLWKSLLAKQTDLKFGTVNKQKLLKLSWMNRIDTVIHTIYDLYLSSEKNFREIVNKFFASFVTNPITIEGIVHTPKTWEKFRFNILNGSMQLDGSSYKLLTSDSLHLNKDADKHETSLFDYMVALLRFLIMETDYGLKNPFGEPIDYRQLSDSECYYFWFTLSFSQYSVTHTKNYVSPLIMQKGARQYDDEDIFLADFDEKLGAPKRIHLFATDYPLFEPDMDIDQEVATILSEAYKNKIYSIPFGGTVELHDEIFRYVDFYEDENVIHIYLYDEKLRYLYERVDFHNGVFSFANKMFNINSIRDYSTEDLREMKNQIHRALAFLIRDFWVVVDREKNLGPIRRARAVEGKGPTSRVIYIPRIKYRAAIDKEVLSREVESLNSSRGGWRTHSVAKLPEGHKASKLQIFLAEKQNINIPEGFTYRKAHTWGKRTKTEAEIIYRSRSIAGSIYRHSDVVEYTNKLNEMTWLKFEELCVEIISILGWIQSSARVGDGGVDIEAFRSSKNGDVERLFVECKHQERRINPGVLRGLIGAKFLEDDPTINTHNMVISSSGFSSGCYEVAKKAKIILMDKKDLMLISDGHSETIRNFSISS